MHIEVRHNTSHDAKRLGYQRLHTLESVFELDLPGDQPFEVAELAFRVLNSWPDDMLAPVEHLPAVRAYRTRGLRSLSVGDVLVLGGWALAVGPTGFENLAWCLPQPKAGMRLKDQLLESAGCMCDFEGYSRAGCMHEL